MISVEDSTDEIIIKIKPSLQTDTVDGTITQLSYSVGTKLIVYELLCE